MNDNQANLSTRRYKPVRPRLLERRKVDPVTGCWVWQGPLMLTKGKRTYGSLHVRGVRMLAHRASYEEFVGPIPKGLEIDHLCKNQACINPDHLEAVTARVNQMRGNGVGAVAASKTHCPQGHAYSDENTLIMPSNRKKGQVWRLCATCYPERKKTLMTVALFMKREAS